MRVAFMHQKAWASPVACLALFCRLDVLQSCNVARLQHCSVVELQHCTPFNWKNDSLLDESKGCATLS